MGSRNTVALTHYLKTIPPRRLPLTPGRLLALDAATAASQPSPFHRPSAAPAQVHMGHLFEREALGAAGRRCAVPTHPRRATGLDGELMEEEEAVEEEDEDDDGQGEQREQGEQQQSGGGGGGGSGGVCAVCAGCWDEGGSALFPYYRCRKCALPVHAACRPLAHAALACPPQPPYQGLTRASLLRPALSDASARLLNRHGVVTVRVRQAYELPAACAGPGQRVYVVCRLLPWAEKVRTPLAVVGPGGEALWSGSPSGSGSGIGSGVAASAAEGEGQGEGAVVSLLHPYNSAATPAPILRLELWSSPSSVTSLLDKCLGAAGGRLFCLVL